MPCHAMLEHLVADFGPLLCEQLAVPLDELKVVSGCHVVRPAEPFEHGGRLREHTRLRECEDGGDAGEMLGLDLHVLQAAGGHLA